MHFCHFVPYISWQNMAKMAKHGKLGKHCILPFCNILPFLPCFAIFAIFCNFCNICHFCNFYHSCHFCNCAMTVHHRNSIYTLRTSNVADIENPTPLLAWVFWKHPSPRIAPLPSNRTSLPELRTSNLTIESPHTWQTCKNSNMAEMETFPQMEDGKWSMAGAHLSQGQSIGRHRATMAKWQKWHNAVLWQNTILLCFMAK